MLSSNSSSSNHNSNYKPFYENDITSFTSEEDPNFFFPFPNSPHTHFEYDVVNLHHLFDPDFDFITTATNMVAADPVAEEHPQPQHQPQPQPPPPQQQPPAAAAARRRNSKKDRHSKIDTARGPRDRRMRLSLEIARKFFDLQDLLGYDKASRTVDWLLRNSASAINELRNSNSSSVVIGESCTSEECGEAASSTVAAAAKERRGRKGKRGGPGGVEQKRAAVHVGRESRRKARDRARERTSQKRRLMNERESTVGSGKGSCTTNHNYEVEDLSSDEARMSTTAAAIICPWNTTSLPFHHHASSTPAFLHQGEQITEFQFDGKPWEAYNSFNLSG